MVSFRRPPTFMPGIPSDQPAITPLSGNVIGSAPRSHDESNCRFDDQDTPTYCAVTLSVAFASSPVPTLMSSLWSSHGGSPSGMTTVGLPSTPASGPGAGALSFEHVGGGGVGAAGPCTSGDA